MMLMQWTMVKIINLYLIYINIMEGHMRKTMCHTLKTNCIMATTTSSLREYLKNYVSVNIILYKKTK